MSQTGSLIGTTQQRAPYLDTRVSDFVKPGCRLPHNSSLDFTDNAGKNLETVLAVEVTIRLVRDSNDAILRLTNYSFVEENTVVCHLQ